MLIIICVALKFGIFLGCYCAKWLKPGVRWSWQLAHEFYITNRIHRENHIAPHHFMLVLWYFNLIRQTEVLMSFSFFSAEYSCWTGNIYKCYQDHIHFFFLIFFFSSFSYVLSLPCLRVVSKETKRVLNIKMEHFSDKNKYQHFI